MRDCAHMLGENRPERMRLIRENIAPKRSGQGLNVGRPDSRAVRFEPSVEGGRQAPHPLRHGKIADALLPQPCVKGAKQPVREGLGQRLYARIGPQPDQRQRAVDGHGFESAFECVRNAASSE